MADWQSTIEQPKPEQLHRVGAPSWDIFKAAGARMAPVIANGIKTHFAGKLDKPKTLDFGCGVGRVYLPLHFSDALDLYGCDVDPDAPEYLCRALNSDRIHQSDFTPPLKFADNSFDCVYSVSIWTHLTLEAGERWLHEIRRILKPGGVALIPTSGFRAMASRRKRGTAVWVDMTDDDLRREGLLFVEYAGYKTNPAAYPGVTESYGLTAHDPKWIRENWSKVMPVRSVEEAVIDNVQDLVTMVKF